MDAVSLRRASNAGASLIVLGFFCAPAFATDIEMTSKIEAVTVYPDGASVTRSLDVDVPPGSSVLLMKGLPATIDPNSVRVEGRSGGALAIASVDLKTVAGDPTSHADPERAAKLERLKAEQAKLAGSIEAAEAQKSAIQRFAQSGPDKLGADGKGMDVADWPKAWAAIGDGFEAINGRLRELREQDARARAEIAALLRVDAGGVRPGQPTSEVRLVVDADGEQKATLTLRYQVRGAGWVPLYDAALKTEGKSKPSLTLTRRAKVTQRTGEDWRDIGLTLSTVRLNRGTSAPGVDTSVLTLLDPEVVLESPARGAATSKPAAPRAVPLGAPEPALSDALAAARIRQQNAVVEAGAYQASFTVPGRASVPQDGTEKSFTLASRAIDPEILLRTAPSLDATAYIEAGFTNEDEAPLLRGQVMIHRDGIFVGKGQLPLVAAGDKATLGFGADDAVKVTRVPVRKRANDGGFLASNRSDTQDYKTTIRNLHDFAVKVAMVDRIPVSENTAITVEPLATNTPPTEKTIDDKRGVMGWTYEMKPSETKEIRLGWRVRWPTDRDLATRTN